MSATFEVDLVDAAARPIALRDYSNLEFTIHANAIWRHACQQFEEGTGAYKGKLLERVIAVVRQCAHCPLSARKLFRGPGGGIFNIYAIRYTLLFPGRTPSELTAWIDCYRTLLCMHSMMHSLEQPVAAPRLRSQGWLSTQQERPTP